VRAAALSTRLPFRNQRWSSDFTADGWPPDRPGVGVRHDEVTPGLFATLGVPLVRGRDFGPADGLASEPVVIVNRALAEKFFPGENPVGRHVAFDAKPDEGSVWRTIVGVVGDVRRQKLALEEEPSFYAPLLQDTSRGAYLLVKADEPTSLLPAVRDRLREIDPELPLFEVTSLEAVVESSVARERFLLSLLGGAGIIALVLTAAGVFGVALYATTRRLREIGIRVALGAPRAAVAGLALRSGVVPALAGVALGGILVPPLSAAMSEVVFGVSPADGPTLAGAAALVVTAALLASAVPVRRALRIDPSEVLRSE